MFSFKFAWRNIKRNKAFSIINIAGLALGMAASIVIYLWVQDEKSIGATYKNSDRLYRVLEHEYSSEKVVTDDNTPGLLSAELKKVFPEVVYAAGLSGLHGHIVRAGDKGTKQVGRHAGEDWFKLYDIPLLAGNANEALNAPTDICISKKFAQLYFENPSDALGKTLRFDDQTDYQVSAVFELPSSVPDKYDFLMNWEDYLNRNAWLLDWTNAGPATRILLRPDADPVKFNEKMKWFLKGRNTDFNTSFYINLFIQPEKDAYLYSNFKNAVLAGGRIQYVRLLNIVAIFLLGIACINFMNLATARSVKRAKEVGVRKVVGAGRGTLIRQFMTEALLLTGIGLLLAIVLVVLLLPAFNHLTGKELSLKLTHPREWAGLGILLLLISAVSGSYPALFLSSLKPVKVLKGVLKFKSGATYFRKGLVIFQFMMSVILIVGTVVIYRQLHFLKNTDIGYERGNLISISADGKIPEKFSLFKERLMTMPGIESVSHGSLNPLYNGNTTESVDWPGKDPNVTITFNQASIAHDYARTLKLKFLSGRDFDPRMASDSAGYIVNEAAAKSIGYKEPVGKPLTFWGRPGIIIGLVKDFHFNSLHQSISPMIIRLSSKYDFQNIMIRTKPGEDKLAIAGIQKIVGEINPGLPVEYSYVEEGYKNLYRGESTIGTLATIFSLIAIFIACLGLLGLAAFAAEQRTKEIGVRKVLGASVLSIVTLLSRDFVRLVVISIILAIPIASWTMNLWLNDFAYKISVEWWFFVIAGFLSVFIALATISFQSIKAALVNPSRSLKSE